ncbi:MAG: deoxyribose-phosphate aldolase [Pirellulales bacterium]|nr:deoxyribose-phosphate aldolase [Pirellulales bacterium]
MEKIANYIDHTILQAWATRRDIEKLCAEAKQYGFHSVCVNPFNVSLAAELLTGSGTSVCTVIGFPLGANKSETKAAETRAALADGAEEFDMVINVGALKDGRFEVVQEDIAAVVAAAEGKCVKVIIETMLLDDAEKVKACEIAKAAGAHFVKTCSGFTDGGATVEDIRLMRETVGQDLGVKASGKVRDYEKALSMIEAGASRLGVGAGVEIAKGEADARKT